jgi:hypothetical protein
MKKWIYVFMFLAITALGFNTFQIEWSAPLEGKSLVACIGVLASACALLLLVLLSQSLKVAQKLKRK